MLLPALNSKLPRLPSALLICPGRFLKKFKMLLTPLETAVLAWFIAFWIAVLMLLNAFLAALSALLTQLRMVLTILFQIF